MNISVVIPTYNAEPYIEKAVASALQFSEVKEVIIVEDASTDDTLKKCRALANRYDRVHLYQHEDGKNHGDSVSRNMGIEKATCEFIAFLDADDYYLSNRFDAEKVLFQDFKVDGVFGGIGTDFINEKGKKDYIDKFGENFMCTVQFAAEGRDVFFNMVEEPNRFGSSFSMIALTVRKSALENPKLRMPPNLKISQDKEFIIRLAYHKHLKTGIINQPVANRSAHDSNSITKIKNHTRNAFKHQSLLYGSLYKWAKNQENFPLQVQKLFKYKYLSSKIASQIGFAKYINFARYAIINPELLRTRYRYFAIRNNEKE